MDWHGRVIWSELNTRDPETAKRFFATTMGWTFEPKPMGDGVIYWIAKAGDHMAGGLFNISAPVFDGVPEHWLTYLGVDDVDESVAGIAKAGGTVLRDPWTVPGVGRMALVRAPGGAVMSWMTPFPPVAVT